MKCRYCSAEYQGDICPDCGTPAGMNRPPHQQHDFLQEGPVFPTPQHPPSQDPFVPPSPAISSAPSRRVSLTTAVIAVAVIAFLILGSYLYLQQNIEENTSISTYSIVVSPTLQEVVRQGPPQAGDTILADQYSELSYQADTFQGLQISCWVQVLYNAQQTEDGAYFAFRTISSKNSGQELYGVAFWPGSASELYDGRYLSITGTILGEYTYTDSFGYEDSGPAVYLTDLAISSYAEIFAPAIATIFPDLAPVTHNGCTIDLTRVEFAETETRFYLYIKNDTADHLKLYLDQTTAYQDNRRYYWQENYEADYTLLFDGVEAGESQELILAFPPMSDRWKIQLSVEVNSYPSQPFVFYIPGTELSVSTPVPAMPSQTPLPSSEDDASK